MRGKSQGSTGEDRAPESRSRGEAKRLNVYGSWCKRCGICVAFCPKKALERGPQGLPRWRDAKACVACRLCELRCPDFAIEVVEEEKEHG